jgi:hypothetical protein
MSYQPLWALKWVLDTISEYISRLAPLASVLWVNWDVRATIIGTTAVSGSLTTVSTVTTCATLTNQTNIWWTQATNVVAATTNLEAILWNIDNIYIS